MSRLALFEDERVSRFLPLSATRPVWALRLGTSSMRDEIERVYGRRAGALFCRDELATLVAERSGLPVNRVPEQGHVLLVNGRLIGTAAIPAAIPLEGTEQRYLSGDGALVAARIDAARLARGWDEIEALPAATLSGLLLEWPWELVDRNGERITQHATRYPLGQVERATRVHLVERREIYLAEGVELEPGVILDARDGPIVIERGARIMAQSVVQGPCHIGEGATLKIGTRLYHGCSIGPRSKVGGELEATIIHGFSNKQHDGFLGHAYVGEWCNLGAGTSNSDLKNTYGTVRVWCDGDWVDTGSMFVGCFLGDHVRVGINGSINTGSVFGPFSNIYGPGLPPKYLPPFSWGSAGEGWARFELAKALEIAERVMARRDRAMLQSERALLAGLFERSADERPRG